MNPQHAEVAGNTALYGGVATSLTIFGLGLSEWAAIIAAIVAVGGFGINVWVARERMKRERELHELTKAQLTGRFVKVEPLPPVDAA